MKNLLITTGIAILIFTMSGYWLQLHELFAVKEKMKAAADETAAAAALQIDAECFGEGILYFDRKRAAQKAEEVLRLNFPEADKEGRWEILFTDGTAEKPSVTVRFYYRKMKVISVYEYMPLK